MFHSSVCFLVLLLLLRVVEGLRAGRDLEELAMLFFSLKLLLVYIYYKSDYSKYYFIRFCWTCFSEDTPACNRSKPNPNPKNKSTPPNSTNCWTSPKMPALRLSRRLTGKKHSRSTLIEEAIPKSSGGSRKPPRSYRTLKRDSSTMSMARRESKMEDPPAWEATSSISSTGGRKTTDPRKWSPNLSQSKWPSSKFSQE